uniref:Uncharacterized protein n=1 Tax=viral metagenome TaxID=1070528 RepID=A0A6C0H630_9ZZZZ
MSKLYFAPSASLNNLNYVQKIRLNYTCQCIKNRVNNIKTSYKDPSETKSQRISRLSQQNEGIIQFGNGIYPIQLNIFNRIEGQSGGSGRALKNKF